MHINTKAIFEWDNNLKQYIEIHNEGYEYEGEIAGCLHQTTTPSFGGLLGELDIELPEGYEDWTYEYDPARESYLHGRAASEMTGVTAASQQAIGSAYSGLTSGLRDIYQRGKASLMQARQPGRGGFAGGGGNLLDMSIQDLYSGVFGQRGAQTQEYSRFKSFEESEAERKRAAITAGATEDVRVGRADWRQEALGHLMDLQQLYGQPFESISNESPSTYTYDPGQSAWGYTPPSYQGPGVGEAQPPFKPLLEEEEWGTYG